MAFPETPLELLLEILVDGAWMPVPTYNRDPVDVQVGMGERATVTDPGSLAITINNRSGRFSPRNPESDLYGKIGRNTRGRLSVPATESYLELDGDPANTASTPDDAALDITGDLDIRWEGEADWYAPGAQMLIGKWGVSGQRSYHLRLQAGYLVLHVATDGVVGGFGSGLLPALPRRAAVRGTVTIGADWTFRMYWAESLDGPWTQAGDAVVVPGATATFVGTSPLVISPEQTTATPPRAAVQGRCHRAEVRNGIGGTVVAAPDFTAQPGGTTAFVDTAGRSWSVTGTASIRDRADLFFGEISEWPQEWTPDASDAWVSIQGAGVLRRMGQGRKALQSTLRRRIPSGEPLAYWPMEDGAAATRAASALDGGAPLTTIGLQYAAETSLPSSDALPTLSDAAAVSGTVLGAAAGGWHVEMVYKLDALPATEQTMLSVWLRPGTGGVRQVRARVSAASIKVEALDSDGAVVAFFNHTGDGRGDFIAAWNRLQLFSFVSGPQTYVSLAWREVVTGLWWVVFAPYTGTPGTVTTVRGSWGTDFQGMSIGHLAAFDTGGVSATVPGVQIYEGSDEAFTGETAWARMQRLAIEESVPLARLPGPETTEQVGPQTIETLLDLLQAAADADGGLLLEDRRRAGLLYRERSSMYSQQPALTLSYDQAPGLAAPFKPVDDDTSVRNDRTVKRAEGSEARAVLDEGPLSVQDPPDGIGLYDDSVTLSLHADTQTAPIAHWRLHLGTHDGPRYPRVRVMLHKAPDLIPLVLGLSEGDLIRITDLPKWVGFGDVDLIVQGIHHIAQLTQWEVEFTCAPADPWRVGAVAVHEGFEDTSYAVTITNGGTLPWTRTNARSFTGSWSLRSGAITNNQTSDAIVSVPAGATALTFAYRVSSEASGPGFEGDRLTVLVDGVQVLRAQGTTSVWTRTTIDVTGKSAITFRYAKDNSSSAGEDTAWIDDLLFEGVPPVRVDTATSELSADATDTATALTVAGLPWSTSAADLPYTIRVGGEEMQVTAISGATSPQTFTVTRSLNGVTKPHTAGAPVQLADPAVVAL